MSMDDSGSMTPSDAPPVPPPRAKPPPAEIHPPTSNISAPASVPPVPPLRKFTPAQPEPARPPADGVATRLRGLRSSDMLTSAPIARMKPVAALAPNSATAPARPRLRSAEIAKDSMLAPPKSIPQVPSKRTAKPIATPLRRSTRKHTKTSFFVGEFCAALPEWISSHC